MKCWSKDSRKSVKTMRTLVNMDQINFSGSLEMNQRLATSQAAFRLRKKCSYLGKWSQLYGIIACTVLIPLSQRTQ